MRLSWFYADNNDVARSLLYDLLLHDVPADSMMSAWFSVVNIDRCRKMYREFGLDDPESEWRMMYTKCDVRVPWYKVYAICEHYASVV